MPGQNDHDPSRENRPRHCHGGARSTPLVCCVCVCGDLHQPASDDEVRSRRQIGHADGSGVHFVARLSRDSFRGAPDRTEALSARDAQVDLFFGVQRNLLWSGMPSAGVHACSPGLPRDLLGGLPLPQRLRSKGNSPKGRVARLRVDPWRSLRGGYRERELLERERRLRQRRGHAGDRELPPWGVGLDGRRGARGKLRAERPEGGAEVGARPHCCFWRR